MIYEILTTFAVLKTLEIHSLKDTIFPDGQISSIVEIEKNKKGGNPPPPQIMQPAYPPKR